MKSITLSVLSICIELWSWRNALKTVLVGVMAQHASRDENPVAQVREHSSGQPVGVAQMACTYIYFHSTTLTYTQTTVKFSRRLSADGVLQVSTGSGCFCTPHFCSRLRTASGLASRLTALEHGRLCAVWRKACARERPTRPKLSQQVSCQRQARF